MRTSSAKAKGSRVQQLVREVILQKFTKLEADDVKCATMGETGTDIHLSPAAKKVFPFSVEAKNQERINIWSAIEQAENNTKEGTSTLVVFSRNRLPEPYIAMKLSDFMKLVGETNDSPIQTDQGN